ncbi:MAG: hypothetical protein IPL61_36570 [Myxococcales bacterium]|nr:hypothetical protein [Myxococcales bacterium]
MTVVWEKEYLIKLTEEGLPGAPVTAAASEASRRWRGNEVILTFDDGAERSNLVRPDGTALIVNPVLDRTLTKLRVRRLGPDAMPGEWIVTPKQSLGSLKPGGTLDVSIRARLRHSAWLAISSLSLGAKLIKANTIPEMKIATGVLDAMAPHLDDLSALETVTVGDPRSADPTKQVRWHAGFLQGFQNFPNKGDPKANDPHYRDNACVAFCKTLLDEAHARGLQVLAGYEIVGTKDKNTAEGEAFKAWIHKASPAEVRAHADAIYDFIWVKRQLDFDGLGFDLEIAGLAPPVENMRVLVHRMAELLAPDNRIVTYATATFTTDGETSKEASHLRTQPFWLARDLPNIIARPMGYDGGERYHAESIACALEQVKLHPSQYQMGIKLHQNPMPGLSGNLSDAEVARRCKEIYVPNRVGLIGFALKQNDNFNVPAATSPIGVQSFFPHLNPGLTRVATSGQPLQCPLRTTKT